MPDVTPEATPGQAAYEATLPFVAGDLDGEPWRWDQLPFKQKLAWDAAAIAVANHAGLARILAERNAARAVVTEMIRAYRHLGRDRWASEISGSQLPGWHDRAGLDSECNCPCHGQTLSGVHGTCCLSGEDASLEDNLTAIRAERDDWHEAADGWEGNFHAARKDADRYKAERDAARELIASVQHYISEYELEELSDRVAFLEIVRLFTGDGSGDAPRRVPGDGEYPDAEEIAGFARDAGGLTDGA